MKKTSPHWIGAVLALSCWTVGAAPALAQSASAMDAVSSGAARPFREVLDVVRRSLGGEVVEAAIERRGGSYVYDLTVIDAAGSLSNKVYDARTLEPLRPADKALSGRAADPKEGRSGDNDKRVPSKPEEAAPTPAPTPAPEAAQTKDDAPPAETPSSVAAPSPEPESAPETVAPSKSETETPAGSGSEAPAGSETVAPSEPETPAASDAEAKTKTETPAASDAKTETPAESKSEPADAKASPETSGPAQEGAAP